MIAEKESEIDWDNKPLKMDPPDPHDVTDFRFRALRKVTADQRDVLCI